MSNLGTAKNTHPKLFMGKKFDVIYHELDMRYIFLLDRMYEENIRNNKHLCHSYKTFKTSPRDIEKLRNGRTIKLF